MFRNVVYNINTEEGWTGEIILSTWDEDGKRVTQTIPHSSYLYHEDSRGESTSIFGDCIKRKEFKCVIDRKKWLERNPDVKVFECLHPKFEFLQHYYDGKNVDIKEFNKYDLRIAYMDIEISVEDEFPEPKDANYPINLITYYDTFDEKFYTYALGKAISKRNDVELKCYTDETTMLKEFLEGFIKKEFDVITGWNTYGFDIPYIINRCYKLVGEHETNRLSPVHKIFQKRIQLHADPRDYNGYVIEGISHLDYYLLYRNFVTPIEGQKPSYKLENICQDEIGRGKKNLKYSFKEIWKKDFQSFVDYNIEDVELIVDLNKKRKFLELTRTLCAVSLVDLEKIFTSSNLVIGNILQYTRKMKLHIPYVKDPSSLPNASYTGAFVKEPDMGAYRKGIASFDVRSLYPNIMIALNISPETIVGKIVEETETESVLRLNDGSIKKISNEQIDKLLAGDYSKAANGAIYNTKNPGVLPIFLKDFFKIRRDIQKKIKRLEKQLGENGEEDLVIKNEIENLNMEQLTRKIILNTTYGVCALKFSPFFNIDNAEAVTLSGQKIILGASVFLEDSLRQKYGLDEEHKVVIYNDTDSIYANVDMVVDAVADGKINKGTIPKILHELDNITNDLNTFCETVISPLFFHAKELDRISFARETFCDVAYFFKKKRYLLHIVDDEGKRVDKFKYKGISIARSTYPKFAKDILKHVFEASIKEHWSEDDYIEYLNNLWEEYCEKDFEDISFNYGLGSYKGSTEFLKAEKGSTFHGKGALYYNQLLDKLKLNSKYDKLLAGEMRVCYTKTNNQYGLNAIGFPDLFPEEFREIFEIDYKTMFKKSILQPLDDFCECNGWSKWDFNCENEIDITKL